MTRPTGDLPTRLHIGTQRAGSSFLNNLLKAHPQVSLSTRQEPSFYSWDYGHGLAWYLDTFPDHRIRIDTSPSYFGWPEAPERILDTLGPQEPRFSLILRNPVDYIRSSFHMFLRSGKLRRRYPDANENLRQFAERHPEYLAQGLYYELLTSRWLSRFPLENFHVILFDDFIRDTPACLTQLLHFWGLEPVALETPPSSKNRTLRFPALYRLKKLIIKNEAIKRILKSSRLFNAVYEGLLTDHSPGLSADGRTYLLDFFADDIRKLSQVVGERPLRWLEEQSILPPAR